MNVCAFRSPYVVILGPKPGMFMADDENPRNIDLFGYVAVASRPKMTAVMP